MRQRVAKGALVALVLGLMFAAGRGTAHLKQAYQAMTVQGVIEDEADNWGLGFGAEGTKPTGNVSAEELKKYDTYYVGEGDEKVIYLTFDCGYGKGRKRLLKNLVKNPGSFYFEKIWIGGEKNAS